jgi:cell division protein FtsN
MAGFRASFGNAAGTAGAVVLLFVAAGCAPGGTAGGSAGRAPADGGASSPKAVQTARETSAAGGATYDVEDEMPEKTTQRPAELVERIEPVESDSVSVQDIAGDPAPKQRYDVGYRIQVFASGDRAAAEKMKERIVAGTGMTAYIEYEEGLYKVRAGDFAERKDALQARSKLEGAYPGCWIVRTTIRR